MRPSEYYQALALAWASRREGDLTDEHGFYHGRVNGVCHEIDDEVPDNAHWKGWVW
jgi:hypothetical protein